MRHAKRKFLAGAALLAALVIVSVPAVSWYVVGVGKGRLSAAETVRHGDAIIILGAGLAPDGSPSLMLRDRLDKGAELYARGVAPKIIVSGDHGTANYDEVNAMRRYLLAKGVVSADIFMDHAGFDTYDSVYRARYIFGVREPVVVTQTYHAFRAAYIGVSLGIDTAAVGADANIRYYGAARMKWCELREYASRYKAFWWCLFKARPRILGAPIPMTGSGEVTLG